MRFSILITLMLSLFSCKEDTNHRKQEKNSTKADSLAILDMILAREAAMVDRDLQTAMSQFSEDATWINSQGYFFEGKNEVLKFHRMLAENDSLQYYYEAGQPRIRVMDSQNALAYYSWKMFWYKTDHPVDTTTKEIGLMTLVAQKKQGLWKWIAVSNQHTPWFYEKIEPVKMD